MEVTHFNRTARGINVQIARHANGSIGGYINDGVVRRIGAPAIPFYPRTIALDCLEGAIRKVCPASSLCVQRVSAKEACSMAGWIKRLQATIPPNYWFTRWYRRWSPVGNLEANRLTEAVGLIHRWSLNPELLPCPAHVVIATKYLPRTMT